MYFLILSLLSSLSLAAERPTLPVGVDTQLLKEIELGKMDTSCVNSLNEVSAKYRAAKKTLAQVKTDSQESEVRRIRKEMLKLMEVCGPCRTNKMEFIKVQSENWTVSDGSCQLDEKDSARLKEIFERASLSLKTTKDYARATGGFHNVLEYQTYPHTDVIQGDSYLAFIAVPAMEALGMAFSYFMRGQIRATSSDFTMEFHKTPKPEGIVNPKVFVTSASGVKKELRQNFPFSLRNVLGQWYVNNEGVFRYYTAGDFSVSIGEKLGERVGREILLETLLDLVERTQERSN